MNREGDLGATDAVVMFVRGGKGEIVPVPKNQRRIKPSNSIRIFRELQKIGVF